MADQVQSRAERDRLHAAWLAHPKVRAFTDAVTVFVLDSGLSGRFDAEAMSAVLGFTAGWIEVNGELPESGVVCT